MQPTDPIELLRRIYNAVSGSEPCFHLTRDSSRRDTGVRIMDELKGMFDPKRGGEPVPVMERVTPSPLQQAIEEVSSSPDVGAVIVVTDGEKSTPQTPQDAIQSAKTLLAFLRGRPGLWLRKADILGRTGIPEAHWTAATAHLFQQGTVERQGERRHTKYRATK